MTENVVVGCYYIILVYAQVLNDHFCNLEYWISEWDAWLRIDTQQLFYQPEISVKQYPI